MADSIEKLMRDNLIAVFNERDQAKRQAVLEHIYSPEIRWTDAEGVTIGHAGLEAKCVGLQSSLGDLQFEADGPVRQLSGFGHLAWRLVDPDGGAIQMAGFDTALIKDGVITDLWTVLLSPQE